MDKKSTSIPIQLIPIEDDGYHIMIPARINGMDANLLVDTGASRTVFDNQNISRFLPEVREEFEKNDKLSTGLGTNTLESFVTSIDELELGDLLVQNYQTVILDLMHVNESYSKLELPIIDGVLGSDLLKKFDAEIYYKKKIIKLFY